MILLSSRCFALCSASDAVASDLHEFCKENNEKETYEIYVLRIYMMRFINIKLQPYSPKKTKDID